MTPILRAATLADAARIADILIGVRHAFMPYAPLAHPEPDVRDWVREHLVPTGGVTVADRDGAVLGVMATAEEDGQRWIMQMSVDPSHVGHGIGAMLLRHAIATLAPPIRLWTFQANTGARRFYERHGFHAILFTEGEDNEERCPDVLFELKAPRAWAARVPWYSASSNTE